MSWLTVLNSELNSYEEGLTLESFSEFYCENTLGIFLQRLVAEPDDEEDEKSGGYPVFPLKLTYELDYSKEKSKLTVSWTDKNKDPESKEIQQQVYLSLQKELESLEMESKHEVEDELEPLLRFVEAWIPGYTLAVKKLAKKRYVYEIVPKQEQQDEGEKKKKKKKKQSKSDE